MKRLKLKRRCVCHKLLIEKKWTQSAMRKVCEKWKACQRRILHLLKYKKQHNDTKRAIWKPYGRYFPWENFGKTTRLKLHNLIIQTVGCLCVLGVSLSLLRANKDISRLSWRWKWQRREFLLLSSEIFQPILRGEKTKSLIIHHFVHWFPANHFTVD